MAGGGLRSGQMLGLQPGGADDMDGAGLGGKGGEFDRGGGSGEIDHSLRLGEGLQRVVGHDHARRQSRPSPRPRRGRSRGARRVRRSRRGALSEACTRRISIWPIRPEAPVTTSPAVDCSWRAPFAFSLSFSALSRGAGKPGVAGAGERAYGNGMSNKRFNTGPALRNASFAWAN
jgi:hypothetical protein